MGDHNVNARMKQLAEQAYLGTATLVIRSGGKANWEMLFGEYNEGRKLDLRAVERMASTMEKGGCLAEENPLVVAIQREDIRSGNLVNRWSTLSDLPTLLFTPGGKAKIHVLNGMHRVKAAQRASKAMRNLVKDLENNLEQRQTSPEGEAPSGGEEIEDKTNGTQRWCSAAKDTIELTEKWPLKIYDKGESHLSGLQFDSTEASGRSTGTTIDKVG